MYDCPICSWSPDNVEYRFLFETESWRAVLAPNQSLVGRCVLHLKRHAGDIANLTRDELLDWLAVVQTFEAALHRAFGATMFNWSCYMNHAYRNDPPDPHVHWWGVPRYNHPVVIDEWVFEDPQFGSPYDHYRWVKVPPEIQLKIVQRIQRATQAGAQA
jgi:diadenosine tetraphosphate (Ap4A) HIT family hydrolase